MEQREQIVEKIIERLCVLFEKEPSELNENTLFAEDLGAKSGNVTQLTTFLEDEFDVEIPYMQFCRNRTVGEAADYVNELMDE